MNVGRFTNEVDVRHLRKMMTPFGIIEHAEGCVPRMETGICLDDMARLLVLTARGPWSREFAAWTDTALDFIEGAHLGGGRFLDRRDANGRWRDALASDDACGRALWGAGEFASGSGGRLQRSRARDLFDAAASFRSEHLRSSAFAVMGAGAIAGDDSGAARAHELLLDVSGQFAGLSALPEVEESEWQWLETELTYANAVIPTMLIICGDRTDDPALRARGLKLLDWLVQVETHPNGHFSPTPTTGRNAEHRKPGFDQQPIEIASLADACATAWQITGDDDWLSDLSRCVDWFHGANDHGVWMVNHHTGGGYDGLTPNGVNLNQGAESTLALLTTVQYRSSIATARIPRPPSAD